MADFLQVVRKCTKKLFSKSGHNLPNLGFDLCESKRWELCFRKLFEGCYWASAPISPVSVTFAKDYSAQLLQINIYVSFLKFNKCNMFWVGIYAFWAESDSDQGRHDYCYFFYQSFFCNKFLLPVLVQLKYTANLGKYFVDAIKRRHNMTLYPAYLLLITLF